MLYLDKCTDFIRDLLKDSVSSAVTLFKVMIPIVVAVKILQEFELIQYVAMPLGPIMNLVGLPAEMGLAWAGAILNNVYTGLIIFISLAGDFPLTQEQTTILGVLMLVAHALPLESAVSRKAGARFCFQAFIRMVAALGLALLLHGVYSAAGMLGGPATIMFTPEAQADQTLMAWALGQAKNFGFIFLVIMSLMAFMRLLTAIGVIDLLNRILKPILKVIGIGPKASAITVIGLTVGLTYGSGLIIREAQSGNLDKEDVFYSITLMGMSHALIEDTFLLMLIGGHISGLFWGRLLFSLALTAILVRIVRHLSPPFRDRFLWTKAG
ncbi:hypothetical protein [Salidesulfovibrio onnuriiensis]|uniref:hypothetical protein n=1 Tax=Salidesulfovibrio onnuriiensis TaxID=2583823 RepID=UPI0011C99EC5|nr:hypothetical protein [Salidesulfovibrio onnuriiensis]